MVGCRVDPAGAGEDVLRRDGGESAIGKLRVRDLRWEHHVPHDLNVVDGPDIGPVDVADVARIGAVAGPIYLARGEREPAHLGPNRAR